MQAVLFSLKRTHQRTLAFTRHLFAPFGLTPARFDLLHAIGARCAQTQSLVRKTLGVTAPTVTRMRQSLEKLGLLASARDTWDARELKVWLTARGRALYRRVVREVLDAGVIEWLVSCAFARRWYDAFLEVATLDSQLLTVRRTLSDHATLTYPWQPDD